MVPDRAFWSRVRDTSGRREFGHDEPARPGRERLSAADAAPAFAQRDLAQIHRFQVGLNRLVGQDRNPHASVDHLAHLIETADMN